jgi:hypothetical protein
MVNGPTEVSEDLLYSKLVGIIRVTSKAANNGNYKHSVRSGAHYYVY